MIDMVKKIIRRIKGFLYKKNSGYRTQIKYPVAFLGSSYGGWSICPDLLDSKSIVYSLGIGEDISFDLELIERFGTSIYAFDPTPKSLDWLSR